MNYPVERWQHAEQLALTAANLISALHEDDPPRPPVRNFTVLTLRNMMEDSIGLKSVKIVYNEELEGEKSGGICSDKFVEMSRNQVESLKEQITSIDGKMTYADQENRTDWTVLNGTLTLRYNSSTIPGKTRYVSRSLVEDTDGFWTSPYHDCWIVNGSVVSYVVPILKATSNTHHGYHIMGQVYVDVKLYDLDINQCSHGNTSREDRFAETHHCHPTSVCTPISGKGFNLGSYECHCKPGYYRPNASEQEQYFDGRKIEAYYRLQCKNSLSFNQDKFACLRCKEGCGNCTSGESCLYQWEVGRRMALLVINCLMMIIPVWLIYFVIKNRNIRIVRSSSFRLLILILVAVEILFANVIVKYFKPTRVTCSLIEWMEHTAFILLNGTLFLRVYRIVLIFTTQLSRLAVVEARMRDTDLVKKLVLMLATIILYLSVWMVVDTPDMTVVVADNGLKFDMCRRTWWHYAVGLFYVCLLVWGAYLGFKVRKVPSSYNESKLIFILIYIVVVLYVFFIILDLFTQFRKNPDYSFIMDFTFCTLRNNLILLFLFANKVYATWKGEGDTELLPMKMNTPTMSFASTHSDCHSRSISKRPGSFSSTSMVMDKFDAEMRGGVYNENANGRT
ncbi:probable G-protein coupled receptor CG31760 isoform X2 [Corticium candelabrum]|nr:probable G-protein coupled receptor CG31760 isoform X2 [Corticium candelabrum]